MPVISQQIHAESVRFSGNVINVRLDDRREISLPFNEVPWLKWLAKATPKQRANWTGGWR